MLIAPQNSSTARTLEANLRGVRAEMAAAAAQAHRTVDSITLVAVSKGQEASLIREAADCGVADFAESYLQEALPKMAALRERAPTWHFIGRLQANKTRAIAECFDWVHGLDRLKVAERLSEQRPHHAPPLQVCLQVNIAAAPGKAGVAPLLAPQLAAQVRALPRLRLRGLMCILPAELDAPGSRGAFAAMRQLLQRINAHSGGLDGGGLDTLSMGMSADFREAILEGATLVRIGSAIFGPRLG
jgi:pyridoxal phosphate enzyme (YggS family)